MRPARPDPLGSSDCEAVGDGPLAQPVNALSSFAPLAAGLAVLAASPPGAPRREAATFAGSLAAASLGSVDFHGPQSRTAHWSHDVGLVAALGFVAVHDVGEVLGWGTGARRAALATVVAAAGVATAVEPAAGLVASSVVGGAAAAGELALVARRRPTRRQGRLLVAGAAVGTAGVVAHLLGRTGGRWCRPASRWQAHAGWHVATSLSLAAWGAARLLPDPEGG